MSIDLLKVYQGLLSLGSMHADSQGFISQGLETKVNKDAASSPTTINGKRLVLPTNEQLKNADSTSKIVFHPLRENITKGESEVLKSLRESINLTLNIYTLNIFQSLLGLVASTEQHAALTPEQTSLIIAIKDADDKTIKYLLDIAKASMTTNMDRLFLNIYLSRGALVGGKKVARAGIVTFPLYKEIIAYEKNKAEGKPNSGKEFCGVKLRNIDRAAIKAIHEFVFPGINEEETYNYGTNTQLAPYVKALVETAAFIATRINDVAEQFEPFIINASNAKFDLSWLEHFEDMKALTDAAMKIPMQHGNEGSNKAEIGNSVSVESALAPVVATTTPVNVATNTQTSLVKPLVPDVTKPLILQAPQTQPVYNQIPQHLLETPTVNARTPDGKISLSALKAAGILGPTNNFNQFNPPPAPYRPRWETNQAPQYPMYNGNMNGRINNNV